MKQNVLKPRNHVILASLKANKKAGAHQKQKQENNKFIRAQEKLKLKKIILL